MFSATAHYHTRAALLDRLNAAWVAVADSDREAAALAQKAEKKGMPLNSVMLPLRCFERMLSQPQVAILFDAERPYGKMDPQTWTYHLEERYYHPSLLHAVKVQRRRRRNELKVEAFLEERFQRVKRRRCSAWVNYVIRRKRCRYLMARNIVRCVRPRLRPRPRLVALLLLLRTARRYDTAAAAVPRSSRTHFSFSC